MSEIRNTMSHQHDYHFLPSRKLEGYFICPDFDRDTKQWELFIASVRDEAVISRETNLQRGDVLAILASVGRLSYGESIQECLKVAQEIRAELKHDFSGLIYRDCHMNLFSHPSGDYSVELEPGMGTTVAAMRMTCGEDAYTVLTGLVWALKSGYLVRPAAKGTTAVRVIA
ncbi:hypothetical protein LCGC14_2261860, partial [marine sediment metagenome]